MQHRNAPLTPNGRRRLVALVEEEGRGDIDCPYLGLMLAGSQREGAMRPQLPARPPQGASPQLHRL